MFNPWDIKRKDFPDNGNLIDKIKFVLGYAILAPSTHNSQPWLFKLSEDSCHIYYNNNLRLPEADPIGRDLYISMGCMIENLVIAASYFGIFKDINYRLEGNYIAEVIFHDEGQRNRDIEYLLDTILTRVNSRGLFDKEILPKEIRATLLALNNNPELHINFITDKDKIKIAASLTDLGQRIAHGKSSFRKEMSGWMHNSLTAKKVGMPGYSLKMPFLLSFVIPTLIKFFDMSPLLAKLNYRSMISSQMICVINSRDNSELIWVETGRLAERSMLYLQSGGISTSIFVASIEMSDLYKELQKVMNTDLYPQFLFCVGYMKNVQRHSPRVNIEEKILT